MKTTILTLASTFVFSCATISMSQAAVAIEVPSIIVRYGDLDLNRTEGLEQLFKRVAAAAHGVCRPLDPSYSAGRLATDDLYRKCLHDATTQAAGSVGRPAFTAFVADKMTRRNVGITLAAR